MARPRDQCQIGSMERYPLREKIMCLTKTLFMAAVMVACATQSLPAWAQSAAELDAEFRQYQSLKKQGKYGEAIPYAQTFIALAEEGFGDTHQNYAVGLHNLAALYEAQGSYANEEPLLKRALAIFEKARGPDHPHVATALGNLAGLYNRILSDLSYSDHNQHKFVWGARWPDLRNWKN